MHNKKSVFINIIVHFITVFIFIILIGNGAYYFSTKNFLIDEMMLNNEQILNQSIRTYEVFLDNTIQNSMIYMEKESYSEITLNTSDSYYYDNEVYDRLNTLTRVNEFIYSIYYFDRNPESIYISTGLRFDSYDFYDREFISTLSYDKNYYVLPARELPTLNSGNKHVIPIVINLPLNSTNYTGTYVINMDANSLFNHLIKNSALDKRNTFKIVDFKNMILASSSDTDDIFREIESFSPKLNLELQSNSLITELDGKKQLVSYCASEKYDWRYITFIDYDLVFSNIEKPLKINIVVALVSLIISFILIFFVSKEVYSPIKEIINIIGIDVNKNNNHNEYILIKEQLNRFLDENKQFKETIDSNKSALKKQFVYSLIALNSHTHEEIEQKMSMYDIKLLSKGVVLIFAIDDIDSYINTFNVNDRILWELAFENILIELANKKGCGVFSNIETGKFALAFSMDSETKDFDMENATRKLIYEIKEKVSSILKYSVTAGIGLIKNNYELVHESYKEATKALQFKASLGDDEIIFYKEIIIAENANMQYPYDIESNIVQNLLMGNFDESKQYLKEMFERFSEHKIIYPVKLHTFAVRFLNTLVKLIMELGIDESEISINGQAFSSMMNDLMKTKTKSECVIIFSMIIESIGMVVSEKRNNIIHDHVQMMLNYINENFSEIISLDIIADYTNLNRCYVGRIFKQYMNMGIVDYVNQVRIEKAVELLETTEIKVSDIANIVGYNNTNYFIKIFKKNKNVTPGKYKEKSK